MALVPSFSSGVTAGFSGVVLTEEAVLPGRFSEGVASDDGATSAGSETSEVPGSAFSKRHRFASKPSRGCEMMAICLPLKKINKKYSE